MTINRATSSYQPRLKNPSISARCVAQKLAEALMLSVCYLLRSRAAAGHIKEQRLPGPLRMIVGTGIDIAEVDRVAASIERFGKRFLERVFTPAEIRYCESKANKAERYAGRFAAKEAAMKAIGTGWSRGVRWQDVEVTRVPGGRPTVTFHGKAAEFFHRLGAVRAHLSITHTQQSAMAQIILEADESKQR